MERLKPFTHGMCKGGRNIPNVDGDGYMIIGPRPPAPQGSGGGAPQRPVPPEIDVVLEGCTRAIKPSEMPTTKLGFLKLFFFG